MSRSPAVRYFEDWLFFLACWLRRPVTDETGEFMGSLGASQAAWLSFVEAIDLEADAQVRAVQAYAKRVGGTEAFYQHYITERCEPGYAPKSVLGNDPRKWVHL